MKVPNLENIWTLNVNLAEGQYNRLSYEPHDPGVLLELRFSRGDNTSSWKYSRVDTIIVRVWGGGKVIGY